MRAVSVDTKIIVGINRYIKNDLRAFISGSNTGSSYNLIIKNDITDNKTREKIRRIILVIKLRRYFPDCIVILDIFINMINYGFYNFLTGNFKKVIIKATLFLYSRNLSPYLAFKATSSIFPSKI